jgi:para-nitrobenzyl esterase
MNNTILKIISTKAIILLCSGVLYSQEVNTKNGVLRGVLQDGIEVFKGVPFATPPVGDLRWQAPKPAKSWDGVRLVNEFSPICMQIGMYPKDSPLEEMSEDCLYLNIWKPEKAISGKVPVMVWFYGGGLVNGSASTPLYSGKNLAKQEVIVITANYRLGALGFLAHPELSIEADYNSSGNYGLLDMIATLQWIQENIHSFGGDPNNVTIFGQSSGAISISVLITSPLARGLFHKAIGQSGGLFEPIELDKGFSLEVLEQAGIRYATRAGATSLKGLRKIPAEELLEHPVHTSINIDGYVLTQPPFEAYIKDEYNKVSVILGNTVDEGQEFISDLSITKETYSQNLKKHFPGWLVRLTAPNPGLTDDEAYRAAVAFEGDIRFKWNMWMWARLASKEEDKKVFIYQFAKAPPFPKDSDQAGWGATHGSELAYVFGNIDHYNWNWAEDDYHLSNAMVKYWTNFAKYGNPNSERLPHWPEFSVENPKVLYLNSEIKSSPLITEGTLSKIDRVYSVARFIIKYKIILILLALSIFSYLIFVLVKRVINRRIKT